MQIDCPLNACCMLHKPLISQSSLHTITQSSLLASGANSFAMKTLAEQVKEFMAWRSQVDKREFTPALMAAEVAKFQLELRREKQCTRQNIEGLLSMNLQTPRYLVALARAMGTTAEILKSGGFSPGYAAIYTDNPSAPAELTTGLGSGAPLNTSEPPAPYALSDRRQSNALASATLAQILEGLSSYLVRLGPSDRSAAMQLIAGLEKEPERHAKVAAGIMATTDLGNYEQSQESPPKSTSSDGR